MTEQRKDEAAERPAFVEPDQDPSTDEHGQPAVSRATLQQVFPHLDPAVVARVLGLRLADEWREPTTGEATPPERDRSAE